MRVLPQGGQRTEKGWAKTPWGNRHLGGQTEGGGRTGERKPFLGNSNMARMTGRMGRRKHPEMKLEKQGSRTLETEASPGDGWQLSCFEIRILSRKMNEQAKG